MSHDKAYHARTTYLNQKMHAPLIVQVTAILHKLAVVKVPTRMAEIAKIKSNNYIRALADAAIVKRSASQMPGTDNGLRRIRSSAVAKLIDIPYGMNDAKKQSKRLFHPSVEASNETNSMQSYAVASRRGKIYNKYEMSSDRMNRS